MRTFLKLVGGAALALGILGGGYLAAGAVRASRLETSGRIYIETQLPLILASWSVETLQTQAAPQLLKALTDQPERLDTIREGFDHLAKLGAYHHLSGLHGQTFIFSADGERMITASYQATAVFDNGAARVHVRLTHESGAWRILEFSTDRPIFKNETT